MSRLAIPGKRPAGVLSALVFSTAILIVVLALIITLTSHGGTLVVVCTLGVWAGIATLVWTTVHHHQHTVFGHANQVTLLRAAAASLLAGLVPIATLLHSPSWLWSIGIICTVTLCMDGLDGYLARKSGLSSAFGARFDMETDALLALVITLFLWQSSKAGVWILGLGVMRYVFVAAAIWLPALRADLPPSMRRKTICVIQVGALCLMLCPWLSSSQIAIVGAIALGCLTYSFTADVMWLFRQHRKTGQFVAGT